MRCAIDKKIWFQHVGTSDDHQETYRETEPDFFVHIADKRYMAIEESTWSLFFDKSNQSTAVKTARNHYNSGDVDLYRKVWGWQKAFISDFMWQSTRLLVRQGRRAAVTMAKKLARLDANWRILDIGPGYCVPAYYLAKTCGTRVSKLTLSDIDNKRARLKACLDRCL